MQILVFNSGSSTLKFQLFSATRSGQLGSQARGTVSHFGPRANCDWVLQGIHQQTLKAIHHHQEAVGWVVDLLQGSSGQGGLLREILGVGHRIVHGGDFFSAPVQITKEVLAGIESLGLLAPLHNTASAQVIRACQRRLGEDIPMVAVFDTAFHQPLPDYVRAYALPTAWTVPSGIKRYGFHGIAHQYLYERYLQLSGADPGISRVITFQLGHGCSVTAIRGGSPVETSMGFTPLEGLIMATRPGDVDAGILLHLAAEGSLSLSQLREGLNHHSGLLGLSGASADMRELLKLEGEDHPGAKLAISAFCHRARKYLGAYLAVLGGVDAVVFGGGIGEHLPQIRARICADMDWCGLMLDPERNQKADGIEMRISPKDVSCQVYVIPVDEEFIIAQETYRCLWQERKEK
jgi:acetate kinase